MHACHGTEGTDYKATWLHFTTTGLGAKPLLHLFASSNFPTIIGGFNAVINVLKVNGLQDPFFYASKQP